jgi:hypothetical protein
MPFQKLSELVERFRDLGATRILCKRLSENDNTKQQIYLGGSLEALQLLPYRNVRSEPGAKRVTFKADLDFSWIDSSGHVANAPEAKLILYPKYPEVRLSGFLRGCPIAPSKHMQPLPREKRKGDGPDGRVLFLAITAANSMFAYLALRGDLVAREIEELHLARKLTEAGIFLDVPVVRDRRRALLAKLREIHALGWHSSRKLNSSRVAVPYTAQNGGGYTLEALLGVIPNGISAPDYLGWELKAYTSGRITLMTPEPDAGYYGEKGVAAFVRKYGHKTGDDTLYFTGTHRANVRCDASGHTLQVRGFDSSKREIVDANGGIELLDSKGDLSAAWSFAPLIEHWGRKHAAAAYVKYEKRKTTVPPDYRYLSPVLLGEGTDFLMYLSAVVNGNVVYDPGSKITNASTRPRSKARSQFRIRVADLNQLYYRLDSVGIV